MAARSSGARAEALRTVESEMGVIIRRIKRVIGERAQAVHPDLQAATYLVLSWLDQNGPARASAIVDAFHVDKGSLSRQLQHLEEVGLVVREPDPADGRATLLSASKEGRRRLNRVDDERRAIMDERLDDWSDDELTAFAAQLVRYNRSLD